MEFRITKEAGRRPTLDRADAAAIDFVRAYPLPKGGFRYMAVAADGSETLVRKSSKAAPFANAFLYLDAIASGTPGLGGFFTYGKAPSSYAKYYRLAKALRVELA